MNIQGKSNIFMNVANVLGNNGWCLLHGNPHKIEGDIDLYANKNVRQCFFQAMKDGRLRVVQSLCYKKNSDAFFIADNDHGFLQVDITSDFRYVGRVFYKESDFLEAIDYGGDLPRLATYREFGYYFIKKISKGRMTEQQAKHLFQLYGKDKIRIHKEIERFFPSKMRANVLIPFEKEDYALIIQLLPFWRFIVLSWVLVKHPLQVGEYWISEILRLIKRFLMPTGIFIALLGLDGSGKSSLQIELQTRLAPIFVGGGESIHLRWRLTDIFGNKSNQYPPTVVTNPQDQNKRGTILSSLQILWWLFEYILGFVSTIYPKLTRSYLIIFDRYYHDVLVDRKRYRYGGNLRLAQTIAKFVPRPDLFFILDLPVEIAHERKPEVPIEDAKRMKEEYLKLASSLPNAYVVDASKPLDEVASDVELIVLKYMSDRTVDRLDLR